MLSSCFSELYPFTVALPFCDVRLSAKKPLSGAYPKELKTIGDYLRRRRLDLGLTQKEAGTHLGVTESAVWDWESGWSKPHFRFFPRITKFLGYEPPLPKPISLGGTITHYRYIRGISQKELAKQMVIDPTTLSRLERNQGRCLPSVLKKVLAFLSIEAGNQTDLKELE